MFTGTNTTGVFGRMGGSPERQVENVAYANVPC
nr:MAG TPA: hypothetical protein [Caudoviricetes sp.]